MKTTFKMVFCALVAMLLVACKDDKVSTETIIEIVRYKVIVPDSRQLEDCYTEKNSPKPIDVQAFAKQTADKKEAILHDFADAHLTILEECNVRTESLRRWFDQQIKLYETSSDTNKESPK